MQEQLERMQNIMRKQLNEQMLKQPRSYITKTTELYSYRSSPTFMNWLFFSFIRRYDRLCPSSSTWAPRPPTKKKPSEKKIIKELDKNEIEINTIWNWNDTDFIHDCAHAFSLSHHNHQIQMKHCDYASNVSVFGCRVLRASSHFTKWFFIDYYRLSNCLPFISID